MSLFLVLGDLECLWGILSKSRSPSLLFLLYVLFASFEFCLDSSPPLPGTPPALNFIAFCAAAANCCCFLYLAFASSNDLNKSSSSFFLDYSANAFFAIFLWASTLFSYRARWFYCWSVYSTMRFFDDSSESPLLSISSPLTSSSESCYFFSVILTPLMNYSKSITSS